MTPFQIILAIIATLFLTGSTLSYLRTLKIKYVLMSFAWLGVDILAINPDIARALTSLLGVGENLNTLIFAGFVAVVATLFMVLRMIEEQRRDITRVVSAHALERFKDDLESSK